MTAATAQPAKIKYWRFLGLPRYPRKGNHGGRPPVITNDMLHTVLRRRANGETVEDIQPDLLIPTGRRKGQMVRVTRRVPGSVELRVW